jgi:hypothetical protein
MKKRSLPCLLGLLLFAVFSTTAYSASEKEYIIQKEFDTVTPIYMEGHAGNPAWIEGFEVAGDIFYGGSKIGEVEGEVWLWNPPMLLADAYSQVGMVLTNTIGGLGTFEVHGQGVVLGSSNPSSGHVVISWQGSISNGTGSFFTNVYGVSAGAVTSDVFAQTSEGSEIILIRKGF